jgi:hypothetical protein
MTSHGEVPQFSVITPSFRQGVFIERTILSVLAQENVTFDYVVCDGGSDDGTVEILQRYGDRLRWVSEPDRGQADAINKGIAMTQGEIIAWINSDDLYYPQAFEQVYAYFAAHGDVDVVYGQAQWVDERDCIIEPFPTEKWNYRRLQQTCFLCQPAVFFRRRLLEQMGSLDLSLHYCLDYELWLRYGQRARFHYLPVTLAASRLHEENKTLGQALAMHQEVLQMLQGKFGRVPESWVLGYALTKVEQETQISRFDDAQFWPFVQRLLWTSGLELMRWRRQVWPTTILKMLGWVALPNLAWFRRRKLLHRPAQALTVWQDALAQQSPSLGSFSPVLPSATEPASLAVSGPQPSPVVLSRPLACPPAPGPQISHASNSGQPSSS